MITGSHSRVAMVDDDESLCRSMTRLLRAAGIELTTYISAEAFLEDAEHSRFSCLLLDIELGGMSGIELHQRLLAEGSTAPVIYITAHHEPEVRERALNASCKAYFQKTEPADALLKAIRSAIGGE